jgi:hypothetical protein
MGHGWAGTLSNPDNHLLPWRRRHRLGYGGLVPSHSSTSILTQACVRVAVYDVSNRESYTHLEESWIPEVKLHCKFRSMAKVVVANKVDKV